MKKAPKDRRDNQRLDQLSADVAINESRRAGDNRLDAVAADIALLKVQMLEHREVTNQIRDILAAFAVAYRIAKWVAAIGAAIAVVWHGFDVVKKV